MKPERIEIEALAPFWMQKEVADTLDVDPILALPLVTTVHVRVAAMPNPPEVSFDFKDGAVKVTVEAAKGKLTAAERELADWIRGFFEHAAIALPATD